MNEVAPQSKFPCGLLDRSKLDVSDLTDSNVDVLNWRDWVRCMKTSTFELGLRSI